MTWSQVAEIWVRDRRSLWSWLLPSGTKLVSWAELDFSGRARTRPVGVDLDLRYLDGGAEEVVAAIRRFTGLPVIRTW